MNTATAIYELVDNAIEARARNVHVVFGFAESLAKPNAIAVIDDGYGMESGMLRLALAWGGTHRENGREGFGRFGYGLPTASVSQGRRFSVFAQASGHALYASTFDLDDLDAKAKSIRTNGHSLLPTPARAALPPWLEEYVDKFELPLGKRGGHGTAVVIDKLDNLTWKTSIALERNLARHLGVTYRNFIRRPRSVFLQGRRIAPIDPLFLEPTGQYYDVDSERAESIAVDPLDVLSDRGRVLGTIKVRAAYFPPTFGRFDKRREATGLNANARFTVMKENNGIIVLRQGRQLDVITSGLWTQIQNNDRYWAVEIDFPPALDELFSVTTNKQRVILGDQVKEVLHKAKLPELIEELRSRYKVDRQRLLPSPVAPEPAGNPLAPFAKKSGPAVDSVPGGTFYLVRDAGDPLVLNRAHPFFDRVYSRLDQFPEAAEAVDSLLHVLAVSERDAGPELKRFYRAERRRWSRELTSMFIEGDLADD